MDGDLRYFPVCPFDDGDDEYFDAKGRPCCGSEIKDDARLGDREWNAEADAAEGEWLNGRDDR